MKSNTIKATFYGALKELLANSRYYYASGIDTKFNHFTEEGEEEILKLLILFAPEILASDKLELEERARKLVMDGLTK